jgi:hypothetical protein
MEIVEKLAHALEPVRCFFIVDMPVISLPGFVVVPQHTSSIGDQGEPVFVTVPASLQRFRHLPQNDLGEDIPA